MNVAPVPANPVSACQKIRIVCIDIGRAAILDRTLFFCEQLYFQGVDNRLGQFILKREDIRRSAAQRSAQM